MIAVALSCFAVGIFFSLILWRVFIKLDDGDVFKKGELLLHSLGLGPIFTSLILYYCFLLLPNQPVLIYIALVFSIYALIFAWCIYPARKNRMCLFTVQPFKLLRRDHFFYLLVLGVPIGGYLGLFILKILPQPLFGHDMMQYGFAGKLLFQERSLSPVWINNFSENGFLYKILHAPSFALILTWEKMVGSVFGFKGDVYYRSVGAYYGILILLIQFYWVTKKSKILAVITTLVLISALGFYLKFLFPHIDTFRIYFITVSFIYLAYAVEKPTALSLLLFGIFSGFAAFSHRSGLVITAINCVIFFFFMNASFQQKIRNAMVVGFWVLVFGASHYGLDYFLGQGEWLGVN